MVPLARITSKDCIVSSVRPHFRDVKPYPPKPMDENQYIKSNDIKKPTGMSSNPNICARPMGHPTTVVVEGKGDIAEPISRPYRGDIHGIN